MSGFIYSKLKRKDYLGAHQGPNALEHSAKTTCTISRSSTKFKRGERGTKLNTGKGNYQYLINSTHLSIICYNSQKETYQCMRNGHWF